MPAKLQQELVRSEYASRRMQERVGVTFTACLGPCEQGNIGFLYACGKGMWFRGLNDEASVRAVMEYADGVTLARKFLPLPEALTNRVFRRTAGDLLRPYPSLVPGPEARPCS